MSSSQGANSLTISPGYPYDKDVLRDASDWTRQLKEQLAYVSYNVANTGNKAVGSEPWFKYGNQFRCTYLFGRFKCKTCNGALFASEVVGGA